MFNNFYSLEVSLYFFKRKRKPAECVNNSFAFAFTCFPIWLGFPHFDFSAFSALVVLELMLKINMGGDMLRKNAGNPYF